MPDLWPADFGTLDVTPPLAVLREQAELLSRKTRNHLRGHVLTSLNGISVLHQFLLVAPALDNYSHKLFEVAHTVHLYPATIQTEGGGREYACETYKEFVDNLREVLTCERTVSIVRAILAQAEVPPG
jgi:hypothetical protein